MDDEDWPALDQIGLDDAAPSLSRWVEGEDGRRRILVLAYGADVQVWDASGDLEAMTEAAFVKAPCGSGAVVVNAALADGLELVLLCVYSCKHFRLTAQGVRRAPTDELARRLVAGIACDPAENQARRSSDPAARQQQLCRRRAC